MKNSNNYQGLENKLNNVFNEVVNKWEEEMQPAQITKPLLQTLRQEMNEVLDSVSKKHNIKLSVGNCSFDCDSATFKLNVSLPNALTKEEKDLVEIARIMDLNLNKTTLMWGKTLKLWGYKSRGRKYPYVVKDVKGDAKYKVSEKFVAQHFKN